MLLNNLIQFHKYFGYNKADLSVLIQRAMNTESNLNQVLKGTVFYILLYKKALIIALILIANQNTPSPPPYCVVKRLLFIYIGTPFC